MAPAAKSNFKTYESQARLLRAMVAAHPEVKWNHRAICQYYGTDLTEYALQHRFRTMKTHADVVEQAVAQKVDCKVIPADLPKDRNEIARFFGSSTPDGIQFQFRAIKKDADAMKAAANTGGDPTQAVNLGAGSAASTPRAARSTTASTPGTKRSVASVASSSKTNTGGSRKRIKTTLPRDLSLSDEDDELDDNNDLLDTPTKPRAIKTEKPASTPRTKTAAATTTPRVASVATPAPAPALAPAQAAPSAPSIFGGPATSARNSVCVDLTEESDDVVTPPENTLASFSAASFPNGSQASSSHRNPLANEYNPAAWANESYHSEPAAPIAPAKLDNNETANPEASFMTNLGDPDQFAGFDESYYNSFNGEI